MQIHNFESHKSESLRKGCMQSIRRLINTDHHDEELDAQLARLHEQMEKSNRKQKQLFGGSREPRKS